MVHFVPIPYFVIVLIILNAFLVIVNVLRHLHGYPLTIHVYVLHHIRRLEAVVVCFTDLKLIYII